MIRVTVIFILLISISCKQDKTDSVAAVGNESISLDWFSETFTLYPQFQTNSTLKNAYLQHLNYLIEQQHLALAAEEYELDTLQRIKSRLDYVRHKELLKTLYTKEVAGNIEISDEQAWDEYKKQNLMVSIRHLYASDLDRITEIKNQLESGASFEQLAQDVFIDTLLANNGGNLGYLKISDFDPYLVDSIYTLQVGIPSNILKSSKGYHIFRVDDVKQSAILDKQYFNSNLDFFKEEVSKRKSQILSGEFVKDVLKGKSVTINSSTLNKLLEITRKYIEERPSQMVLLKITVTDRELGFILNEIDLIRNDLLVEFSDGQWTVETFLKKLKQMPPMHRPSLTVKDVMVGQIIDMVRDEYLLEEAQRKNLDNDPKFLENFNNYKTKILAAEFQNLILSAEEKKENPEKWQKRRELLYSIKNTNSALIDSTLLFQGLSKEMLQKKTPRIYSVIREQYIW